MNNFTPQQNVAPREEVSAEAAKAFVTQVFGWMFGALLISAGVAWAFSHIPSLLAYLFDSVTGKPSPLYWISLLSPLAIILAMRFGIERLSTVAMTALFIGYAVLMGICLSTIFLVYNPTIITQAFAISAFSFGVMAVAGYTTKVDLSRFGMILFIGLIGVLVSWILNYFLHSDSFSFMIDIACVLIFTGLTAYKMQQIRLAGQQYGTTQPKLAIFWALSLYITFINLFLTILRLLGRRR